MVQQAQKNGNSQNTRTISYVIFKKIYNYGYLAL